MSQRLIHTIIPLTSPNRTCQNICSLVPVPSTRPCPLYVSPSALPAPSLLHIPITSTRPCPLYMSLSPLRIPVASTCPRPLCMSPSPLRVPLPSTCPRPLCQPHSFYMSVYPLGVPVPSMCPRARLAQCHTGVSSNVMSVDAGSLTSLCSAAVCFVCRLFSSSSLHRFTSSLYTSMSSVPC